jgi:hypothetical protein
MNISQFSVLQENYEEKSKIEIQSALKITIMEIVESMRDSIVDSKVFNPILEEYKKKLYIMECLSMQKIQ